MFIRLPPIVLSDETAIARKNRGVHRCRYIPRIHLSRSALGYLYLAASVSCVNT